MTSCREFGRVKTKMGVDMDHKDRENILRKNSSGNTFADMFDDIREGEDEEREEDKSRGGW